MAQPHRGRAEDRPRRVDERGPEHPEPGRQDDPGRSAPGLRDYALLLRPAYGGKEEDLKNARHRSVIGEGYFKYSRWDLMRPQLIMDMIVAGAAFTVYWPDPAFPYPRAMRVDPLACFPTIYNNQLLDLLVITEMTVRQAERMFPGIGIAKAARKQEDSSDTIEVYDFYAADECVRAFGVTGVEGSVLSAEIVQAYEPRIGRVRPHTRSYRRPTAPSGASWTR